MLTLNNLTILGDNDFGEITEYLRKYLPLTSFCPWLASGTPTAGLAMLTNQIGEHPYREPKIGRLIWPTGASRFAFMHLLADSDTAQNLWGQAYNTDGSYNQLQLNIGNPESNQQGTIVSGEVINANVYLLPPTPLSGIRGLSTSGQFIQATGTSSLYLLTVVDQRYSWWYANVGDFTGLISPPIDSSMTWQTLLTNMLTIVNVNSPQFQISLDTISPSYLAPSAQMFTLPFEPIPPYLDAICENIGHRLCVSYDGMTVSTQLYGTALQALNTDMNNNTNRIVLAGGQRFNSPI